MAVGPQQIFIVCAGNCRADENAWGPWESGTVQTGVLSTYFCSYGAAPEGAGFPVALICARTAGALTGPRNLVVFL